MDPFGNDNVKEMLRETESSGRHYEVKKLKKEDFLLMICIGLVSVYIWLFKFCSFFFWLVLR